jgi:hypothetical protein
MRVETRELDDGKERFLVLLPTPYESQLIDAILGCNVIDSEGLITRIEGEVRLSDGYGEHYIRIERKKS